MLVNDEPQVLTQVNRTTPLSLSCRPLLMLRRGQRHPIKTAIQRSEIKSERDSSHMALIMPNASATPMPNIHVKYHIVVRPVIR
ncbi:MAG: hypothetical protein QOD67_2647 [Caballeronia sp.]|nr:hypothetical protein [Caballeronia sp.]